MVLGFSLLLLGNATFLAFETTRSHRNDVAAEMSHAVRINPTGLEHFIIF